MKTAVSLKTAYSSGTILEKQVASNTTKFSSQNNLIVKYSGACTENFENT